MLTHSSSVAENMPEVISNLCTIILNTQTSRPTNVVSHGLTRSHIKAHALTHRWTSYHLKMPWMPDMSQYNAEACCRQFGCTGAMRIVSLRKFGASELGFCLVSL
uniref:Uncharacterized protein n=1 Tax=Rhipicephalus zambeziensis TaxID=60191 RepID=A0A224Y6X9_9ACAR